MIREFLIGSALVGGGGYYVATHTSADIQRTVKATPHDTWRGFSVILPEFPQEMGEEIEFGNSEVKLKPVVTSVDSKEIDFRLMKGQEQMVRIHVRFEPLAGGRETNLMIDADISSAAMPNGRPVLGGSILFRHVLGQMTDKVAGDIESGKLVRVGEAFAEMRRQIAMDPRMAEMKMHVQEAERREAQDAASKPLLDPNEGRLDPRGASVVPLDPNPGNYNPGN